MRYSNKHFKIAKDFFRRHTKIGRFSAVKNGRFFGVKIDRFSAVKIGRLVAVLFLLLGLAVCWQIGTAYENKNSAQSKYVAIPVNETDFEENFQYLAATVLDNRTSPDSTIAINVSDYQDTLEITAGGDYLLTGSLSGNIHILAKEQNVHLFLKDLDIRSKSGPAIYCEEADKLVITLLDGSENTLSDSGDYRAYEEAEACISSECDLTFNGSGKLTVSGFCKDAIHSKDIVKILSGTYNIKCKRTGIHGNDGIFIQGGSFYISSEKNGLKTTKKGPDGRGVMLISGGNFSIIAGRYAFVTAKSDIYIYNCTVQSKSIVSTYSCKGLKRVQEGCVRDA